jgi:hypothetical protein
MAVLLVAVPLALAMACRALWRAARAGSDDPAVALLTLVASALPPGREDWGRGILAELAHVEGRWARWRFAAGSVTALVTGGSGALIAAAGLRRSRPA